MSHSIEDIIADLFSATTFFDSNISFELKEHAGKRLLFINKELSDLTLVYWIEIQKFTDFFEKLKDCRTPNGGYFNLLACLKAKDGWKTDREAEKLFLEEMIKETSFETHQRYAIQRIEKDFPELLPKITKKFPEYQGSLVSQKMTKD